MKVLIGCPTYRREWILPDYLRSIENQTVDLSDIGFCFLIPEDDHPSVSLLQNWRESHPEVPVFELVIDSTDTEHHEHDANGTRRWRRDNYKRLRVMTSLRNRLLGSVREISPDLFFSLDSDILLPETTTLARLVEAVEPGQAVSPLVFMSPEGQDHPGVMSWANSPGGAAVRGKYPLGERFRADVIMAAKMMSPKAYRVDYEFHRSGEDLGWSANCARSGVDLYCASDIQVSHIMSRAMLRQYKTIGDLRLFVQHTQ